MNINALKRNEKGLGGIVVIVIMAIFMFAFMFSKPIVTGLVTGNESLNINGTIILESNIVEKLSLEEDNESMDIILNITINNISKQNKSKNIGIKIKSKVTKVTEKIVGKVRINSPVKFVKKVKLTGAKKDLVVKLPENASNIIVKKIISGIEKDISDKVIVKD